MSAEKDRFRKSDENHPSKLYFISDVLFSSFFNKKNLKSYSTVVYTTVFFYTSVKLQTNTLTNLTETFIHSFNVVI